MASKGTILAAIVLVALIVGGGMLVMFTGILDQEEDEASTLTDALDRSITVETKPETIISVSPGLTEMVYAFGAGSDLIGVTSYCDYPSDVKDRVSGGTLEIIGEYYYNIDEEMIIALQPDIVFLESNVQEQVNLVPKLDQAGIQSVVMFPGENSEEIFQNLMLMGKALHEVDKATEITEMMNEKFDVIGEKIGEPEDKPTVMVCIWWDSASIWIVGNGTFLNEMIERAGGVNAFTEKINGYGEVTKEDIVVQDPDIIILLSMSMGSVDEAWNSLQNDTVLNNLHAVQQGKIFITMGQAENAFLRQSVRMVDGTYLMGMMLYPDQFEQVIPNSIGDDYNEYLPGSW